MKSVMCVLLVLMVAIIGCNDLAKDPLKEFEKDSTFPRVKNLKEYEEITFLPALETRSSSRINNIYAASLLMAWDEIKKEISDPIVEFSSDDLELMNKTVSHKNVLKRSEYSSSIEVRNLNIIAEVYFKKALPFLFTLEKDKEPLLFLNKPVASFGFSGSHMTARIMYYNNDDDFAIKLLTQDKEHEIMLMKSSFPDTLILRHEIDRLVQKSELFEKSRNRENLWKYYFKDYDQVRIPLIEFNIETNFTQIEGSQFKTEKKNFIVQRAYQRTAFVLNERGAKVESEALVDASEESVERPKPKRMFFDRPHLVLLKRKKSKNPYFALFIANTELMKSKVQ